MTSRIQIGAATLDTATGEVYRDGAVLRLEPQPAILLARLAASPGELVTHEELRKAVWGDTVHVNVPQGLHYAVRQIRRALGDLDRSAPMVESVPRRGYRLRAPLTPPDVEPARANSPGSHRWARWPLWVGAAAALFAAIEIADRRPDEHHRIAVATLQALHDLVY